MMERAIGGLCIVKEIKNHGSSCYCLTFKSNTSGLFMCTMLRRQGPRACLPPQYVERKTCLWPFFYHSGQIPKFC